MTQFNGKPIEILLVEDSPGDVRLTIEALKEGKISNKLFVANDGIEALDFLMKKGEYENAVTPDLILLDLNLPKMDGRELLAKIKEEPRIKQIPVVVLTTSSSEEDIINTYELHANCFITKPVDMNQFIHVVQAIEDFWVSIVKLPPKNH